MENKTDVPAQQTTGTSPKLVWATPGVQTSTKYPSVVGPTVSLDARPVVIPILSTVVTFPLVALAVICALRYRAKRARKREHQRRLHKRPCECSVTDAPPRIKVTEVSSPCISVRGGGGDVNGNPVDDDLVNQCRRMSQYQTVSLHATNDDQRRVSRSSVVFRLDKTGSEDLTDFPSEAADDFTYAYDILFRKAQL